MLMPFNNYRYNKTCRHLEACLDLLQYALCFRCASEQGIRPATKRFHHCGRILSHMKGKFTRDQFEAWVADTEHGLFHGLCAAMMAGLVIMDEFDYIKEIMSLGGEFLLVKEKNLGTRKVTVQIDDVINPETYSDYHSKHCPEPLSFEKLMASCLLHDFLKCSGGDAGHDHNLKGVFPDLLERTYSHANPADHQHPLLVADVLELKRFPDHLTWYKQEVAEANLSDDRKEIVDCFYKTVRPALETAFKNRHEVWLAHGPEVPQDLSEPTFPQHPHDWMAIEVDRLPFNRCVLHDRHMESAPWSYLRGVVCLSDFKRLGGEVGCHMEFYRDHYYAKSNLRWDDWAFITYSQSPSKQMWVKALASDLIAKGHKVVEMTVLNKFMHLASVIRDRVLIFSD